MARPTLANQKRVMTRKRMLVIGILSAAIIAFGLLSNHGLLSRWSLSSEQSTLSGEITNLRMREDSLRGLIHSLEQDTLAIERLARERYGYIRPGERVYRIQRDTTDDNNDD